MPEIVLSNGLVARVDPVDFAAFGGHTWSHKKPTKPGDSGYAVRGVRIDGKMKVRSLQREIMDPPPDLRVIFLNHDSLDCRRANLRVVDIATANRHNRVRKDSETGVKGVKYHPASGSWQAVLTVYGKPQHVGCFGSKKDAIAAYEAERRRYFPDQPTASGSLRTVNRQSADTRARPDVTSSP